MIGISFDSPDENASFKAEHSFPFELLSDTERTIGAAYDAVRSPDDDFADFPRRISYLIDRDGVVQKSYEVTDPAGHAGVVTADLRALQR